MSRSMVVAMVAAAWLLAAWLMLPTFLGCLPGPDAGRREPPSQPEGLASAGSGGVAGQPDTASLTAPGPSSPAAVVSDPWFIDRTAVTGIDYLHHSGDSPEKPFPSANGSGLAAFDYDLDGRVDLVLATGNDFPVDPMTAEHANRCYRNLGGWSFRDVTAATGLGHRGYTHGVTVGDVDADGFPDVFVSCYGPDVLYRNLGDGSFEPIEAGVEDDRWSSSAAFLDADGDGLLDLYVCHYGSWSLDDNPFCGDASRGRRVFCSPLTVEPVADTLFRNGGDGRFEDVSEAAGGLGDAGRGLGVIAAHLDDDPHLDLYVANDLNHNVFLAGRGDGRFVDRSDLSGAAYDSLGRVKSSMGIDAADTRGTGRFDLLVTDFQREYNLLFANAGGGMFRDASEVSGVGPAGVQLVSWGVQFSDLDFDGLEDAVITSGHVGDERDPEADASSLRQPGLVLVNREGRFQTLPAEQAGSYFLEPHQGRGLAAADLDGDGDEDLVFNHRDEQAVLLANVAANRAAPDRLPLTVRLVGTRGNRDGIGAVATLEAAQPQMRQVKGGGGYQSFRDPRLFFSVAGEGDATLRIRWPSGSVSEVAGLPAGSNVVVIEPAEGVPPRVHSLERRP
jgi:hypothetical protein